MQLTKAGVALQSGPKHPDCLLHLPREPKRNSKRDLNRRREWLELQGSLGFRSRFREVPESNQVLGQPLVRGCVIRIQGDGPSDRLLRTGPIPIAIAQDLVEGRVRFSQNRIQGNGPQCRRLSPPISCCVASQTAYGVVVVECVRIGQTCPCTGECGVARNCLFEEAAARFRASGVRRCHSARPRV